ncbi:putative bifunctional diguanylate cyclase/phosphodiesterase [Virgisporangium aurantiacum]|uniref:putative bifunctional diguanylate cyclase/phosphodiesterase n=1 Tax=Virgisporangium aurantiacum TaxID=175570 RepID=UPI00194E9C43|nr:bifunctional diguanylate cyclase/phosphodiesterase [Virgisporangium aurantiacum]
MTWARAIRALLCVQVVVVLAYVVLLLVPVRIIADTVRDGVLGDGALVVSAIIVTLRGVRWPADRPWSWPIALGIGTYALGDILYDSWISGLDPMPSPSAADVCYLVMYPLTALGLLLGVRAGNRKVGRGLILDGLVTFLGAAALAGAVAVPVVSGTTRGTDDVLHLVIAAAYPVGDATLVAMVIGVLVLRGGAPGFHGWIGAGLVIFAVADTVYTYRVALGDYVVGTPLDALWATGLAVVAIGVWRPQRGSDVRVDSPWMLTAPLLSVLVAIGVLVFASVRPLPLPVVLVAAATLVAATGRIIDGFLAVVDIARVRLEARTDELTGLGNRRMLYETIETELAGLGPGEFAYLLLIDLDRFKEVNDSLGHAIGDEVLLTVADRLRTTITAGDILVRLGGDEFGVLMPGRDADFDVLVCVEHIAAAISAPISVAGLSLQVESSIGIACAPVDSLDRTDLMRHADVAMYDAKVNHTGHARYDPDRDDNSRERLQLIAELREVLHTDPQQLVVYYQAKCSLAGRVVGAEALVRWQHPVRGLLGADRFVQTAENNSLMPALTRHVLRSALVQVRQWRDTDPAATVSVNLSVTSLLDEGLVDHMAAALMEAGVAADALILELTETMIMVDPERSNRTLHALSALGIKLSIDDYGTGQCSLAYLRDLPVQELKLDRSFVRHIATKDRDAAIVRSTIELAHSLGLVLVAEGVEDLESAALLRLMGCDVAQGFYFGRPRPAASTLAGTADAEALHGLDMPLAHH